MYPREKIENYEVQLTPILMICKFSCLSQAALLVITCFLAVGSHSFQNVYGGSAETEYDFLTAIQAIEGALGAVERDPQGTIIGVDLALERASATDEVLRLATTLPNLRRFRLAGGTVSAEAFATLKAQSELEELFLQDLRVQDEEFLSVMSALPNLRRITLRRLSNLTDEGIIPLFRIPLLRQFNLIEMPITGASLRSLEDTMTLAALDVRNCGQLLPDDYKYLLRLPQLVDLRIGGFAVDDRVLEVITLIPRLRGLTIDGSLISAGKFENFIANSPSAETLETLVLNRNTGLMDNALLEIGNLPRLRRLILGDAMVTGSFLVQLAENEETRPKFNDLSLRRTFMNAAAIASLANYPELQSLQITGVVVSLEGLETILSLPLLERLDLSGCSLDEGALRRLQESELPELLRSITF